jgi:nucleoside-diphosphate kinase
MAERTLLLIKPDGVERRLVGEIIGRIERKGLTVAALEMRVVSDKLT